jgi:hypothetical protein
VLSQTNIDPEAYNWIRKINTEDKFFMNCDSVRECLSN